MYNIARAKYIYNGEKEVLFMRIIVDTMGSDNGCAELTKGACEAVSAFDVDITLVGDKKLMDPVVAASGVSDRITIVDAPVFVTMEDDHFAVKNEKANASMVVAMKLLAEGGGDAVVTAGSTGAAITAATLYIKRIRGIRRAALAPILPLGKNGVVLIDCGANAECTSEYLVQFAYMGSIYASGALGIKEPAVGLLNIGAEHTKGDPLRRETYALLTEAKKAGRLNFIGNIEGRDVPFGSADVVVADGFSGNVLLKSMEGIGLYFARELKKALSANLKGKIGGLLARGNLTEIKKKMNYREIGGSPLVGIAAPVIKAHGSADSFTLKNAVLQAKKYAEGRITDTVSANIEHMKTSS